MIRPKTSFELLSKIFNSICVYDQRGCAVYASRKFLKLMRSTQPLSRSVPLPTDWKRALRGEVVEWLHELQDTQEHLECSLKFDPNTGFLFLTARKSSQTVQIQKVTAAYERLILTLFDHSSLAAALIGLDGVVVKCNPRLHALLGTSDREVIQIAAFVYPEDQMIDADLQQKLIGGDIESYSIEKRLIDKNNEIIWVNLSVSIVDLPIRLNDCQPCFAILFEDITENKKIYRALVRTEEKWKTFVLNSLNLFIQTSNSGQIVYTSPAVERILGYQAEELLDLYLSRLVHPNDLNGFTLALRLWATDSQSKPGLECRWRAKSGLWVCLYIQGQKFPLSLEMDGLIIDGYDITDRKFLESELRASEEKLQSLTHAIPGAVFQCNSTYTMKFISEEIQDITGYSASDFTNSQIRSYISIVHPEDVELVKNAMAQFAEGHCPYPLEYRIIHADGEVRWVSELRQPFDSNGQLTWFDGILFRICATSSGDSRWAKPGRRPSPVHRRLMP